MYKLGFLIVLTIFTYSCKNSKVPVSNNLETINNNQINIKERLEKRDQALLANGADYVAFGSNPSWVLILNKVNKTAEFRLEGKAPQLFYLKDLEYIDIYELHASNSNTDFIMTTTEELCIESGTGEVMPYSVKVEAFGAAFYGCAKEIRKIREIEIIPLELSNKWNLEKINGQTIDIETKQLKRPSMTIDLSKKIAYGSTSCNDYQGNLLISKNRISLEQINMTQKHCNDSLESKFLSALNQVFTYQLVDSFLILKDQEEKEILRFNNIDL